MPYQNDIVEEVRSRNDIVDVISQYVKLTRKGAYYVGLCPFHNEKSPSFTVTPSRQIYHCFGCGAGGDVFRFVMDYENASFPEALEQLAKRAGVEMPKMQYSAGAKKSAKERETLLEINKEAATYYYFRLRQESGKKGYDYLKGRGLSDSVIKGFGLGYSDKSGDSLYRFLRSKGFESEALRQSGLFSFDEKHGVYDKFWNRVIFPIMDVNSRVIGFGGRVMGDGKPKYLNSPETKVFDKSRNLYGLHVAKRTKKEFMILCEGYMDVIAMHQAGFTNAVASLGTALTPGHAALLKRYTKEVLLLYDSDEAGIKAALRAIPILAQAGVFSRVVNLKPYKDPDEFIRNAGKEEFEKRLYGSEDNFMFRVRQEAEKADLQTPQGQNRFFNACSELLLTLSDELERSLYMEAIIKQYPEYGVTVEELGRRVRNAAMKGTESPAAVRVREKEKTAPRREPADDKSQKLLISFLTSDQSIYDTVKKYVEPEDFVNPVYRKAAALLFGQLESGPPKPDRILGEFEDRDEQQMAAAAFYEELPLMNAGEKQRALQDTMIKVLSQSLKAQSASGDHQDMQSLQKLIEKKQKIENLRKQTIKSGSRLEG